MALLKIGIHHTAWDHPDSIGLRDAQRAELDARYGCDDHEPGPVPSAANIEVFLVARDADGNAVGCGGLRIMPVTGMPSAEVKRMYVVPHARRMGIASAVLHELETAARIRGVERLLLETGTEQPDAMRFYGREGYSEIPLYGPYIGSDNSVCFARTL